MSYKIALDLGTSGERAQALDERGEIISTAITMRHPLPGANIMDHLHFAIENGIELSNAIIIRTVNNLLGILDIDLNQVEAIAVCGNPCQLSLFEGIEIRDLAYAGKNLLKKLHVKIPSRNAKVREAEELNLCVNPSAEVIIPPSVRHEVGADSLAMIMKSGMLEEKKTCMVTDYGTNAEMGLLVKGELYTSTANFFTGSAAAGPAIEGQHIKFGMLASPGAICDVDENWRDYVLNEKLERCRGFLADPISGNILENGGMEAKGITGTGVIAAIAMGLDKDLISPPNILTPDRRLHFQNNIYLTEKDMAEALKATGAIRAGHITLMQEAGVNFEELDTIYMAGASGTYVDAIKAQRVGLIPPALNRTVQIGNTSLSMAVDLVRNRKTLDEMQELADSLKSNHVMFADSETFKIIFVNELGLWQEGMPIELYNQVLQQYGLKSVLKIKKPKETIRRVSRDIPVLGRKGLRIVDRIGVKLIGSFSGCTACGTCAEVCPESALSVEKGEENTIQILSEYCNGTACRRCERSCPQGVFKFTELRIGELE